MGRNSNMLTDAMPHLFPLQSGHPDRSRQMAADIDSGSVGGFYLVKGSFSLYSRQVLYVGLLFNVVWY